MITNDNSGAVCTGLFDFGLLIILVTVLLLVADCAYLL